VSTTLNLLTPPKNNPGGTAGISAKKLNRLTVVEQVKQVLQPGGRSAACIGLLTGGILPALTFCVAHFVLPSHREFSFTFSGMQTIVMWAIVFGGQAFSAPKVYRWYRMAYRAKFEAVGAVVLLECIMAFVPVIYLSATALAVLVFVNGVSCASGVQVRP
jgi:hypothetical protein